MIVKPTLFKIHKFDHYHLLIPSRKKKKKKKNEKDIDAVIVRRS